MLKTLLFTIIVAVLAFVVGVELRETPEHLKTEAEKVADFLEDYAFETPKQMTVLYQNEYMDKKTRERVKTIIVNTDKEYLPKSPKAPDSFETVYGELVSYLPDYDFGEQVADKAAYFQWLSPNASWMVTSIETTNGHYSRWVKRSDEHQLMRNE